MMRLTWVSGCWSEEKAAQIEALEEDTDLSEPEEEEDKDEEVLTPGSEQQILQRKFRQKFGVRTKA